MLAWWVADIWQDNPILLISWVFWVIFSIVLHELAHGWVAIWCGDRTPIESGHMTWNPLVHMGPVSLIMFAVAGITWGLMPVDPTRFRGRYDDAKVSFAGPAMNLILATICLVGLGVWIGAAGGYWIPGTQANPVLYQNTQVFLRVGVMLNVFGAIFNLLPVPPLDGSHILSTLLPPYRRMLEGPQAQQFALAAMMALFLFGGRYVFRAAWKVTDVATHTAVGIMVPRAGP